MYAKDDDFSRTLKEFREKAGLSQKDVSDVFGLMSAQFISNWERGVSKPPVNYLKTMAKIYKVDAEELFEKYLRAVVEEAVEGMERKFQDARPKNFKSL